MLTSMTPTGGTELEHQKMTLPIFDKGASQWHGGALAGWPWMAGFGAVG